jgi:anti-sigma B factor antagonist
VPRGGVSETVIVTEHETEHETAGEPADAVTVEVAHRGDGVVLHVSGELDLGTASRLTEAVEDALRDGPSVLVIDLSAVEFLASRGLEVLVLAQQAAGKTSVRVVANSGPTVRALRVSGLRGYLDVHDSVTDALANDG